MDRLKRLFTINTKLEVFLLTFGLAVGATKRGEEYLTLYPGYMGYLLYGCCLGAVFLASAKLLEAVELNNRYADSESDRRQARTGAKAFRR